MHYRRAALHNRERMKHRGMGEANCSNVGMHRTREDESQRKHEVDDRGYSGALTLDQGNE